MMEGDACVAPTSRRTVRDPSVAAGGGMFRRHDSKLSPTGYRGRAATGSFICGLALGVPVLGAQQTSSPPAPPSAPPPHQPASAAHRPTPAQAPAQAATPAVDTVHHFSGVVGVAIDSLHGSPAPLIGATVVVTGTSRRGTTDSTGRFRIDSVPPGTYALGLMHPDLDSIGLAVATQGIAMAAGRYTVVRLSTPSPRTAVELLCPKEKMTMGPSAVIGRVLNADTEEPDSNVRIIVYWTALDVSTSLGVHRSTKVREARTDGGGLYRVCGVPSNMTGQLRASRGGITTADVPVAPQGDYLVVNVLYLGTPDTGVVASASPAGAAAAGAAAAGGAGGAGSGGAAAPAGAAGAAGVGGAGARQRPARQGRGA